MYGLPKDFDGSVFVGREVEQVAFSINTVHLSFDEKVGLTIESSFVHTSVSPTDKLTKTSVPVAESSLMRLIGKKVETVDPMPDGTLKLYFEDGQVFICFDDSVQYESYHIWNGDTRIIV